MVVWLMKKKFLFSVYNAQLATWTIVLKAKRCMEWSKLLSIKKLVTSCIPSKSWNVLTLFWKWKRWSVMFCANCSVNVLINQHELICLVISFVKNNICNRQTNTIEMVSIFIFLFIISTIYLKTSIHFRQSSFIPPRIVSTLPYVHITPYTSLSWCSLRYQSD